MAAASLSVNVGSFSDPPDLPGLAHFLEHMVFMGSSKYPEENAFDEYLKVSRVLILYFYEIQIIVCFLRFMAGALMLLRTARQQRLNSRYTSATSRKL